MSSVRGPSRRCEETLDLIALWGERRVQEARHESHRNRDIYLEISKGMAAQGHKKNTEESRTKAKGLRREFKQVMSHNSKSGVAPATCPFFSKLKNIFQGDAIVLPRRLSQSLIREVVTHQGQGSTTAGPPGDGGQVEALRVAPSAGSQVLGHESCA